MRQIVHGRAAFRSVIAFGIGVSIATGTHRAHAASVGCAETNHGALNAEVASGGTATRSAALFAGETIDISVTTKGSTAIELATGNDAPQRIYMGSANGTATFAAPAGTTYVLRYIAGASAPVTIRASCLSAEDADARRTFLARRTDLLSSQDPDRTRIDRPDTGLAVSVQQQPVGNGFDGGNGLRPASVSVSLSDLAAAANPGAKRDPTILDFWIEGRYQPYETAYAGGALGEGNLGVMYLGTKYMLGPDIMLGALAQFDRTVETSSRMAGDATASGWMMGPYMSVRFGPGVFFDGRVAWGTTETSVPGVGLADTGSGDRRLVRGKLRGNRDLGGWTFAPSIGLSYVEDGALSPLAVQDTVARGQGRLDVLPEVKRRFQMDDGTYVEPRATVGGFMTFDDLTTIKPGSDTENAELRMKAEAGVAVGVKDGMNLEASGGVETGGASAPDNYTGRLRLNVPLGKQ